MSSNAGSQDELTFSERCTLESLTCKWASYIDLKNWEALRKLFTANIIFDYTAVNGYLNDDMSVEDYMKTVVDNNDDPEVFSQHLLGIGMIQKISPTKATASYQIRVSVMRIQQNPRKQLAKFTAYGGQVLNFELIDQTWKISGLKPSMGFVDGDVSDLFKMSPKTESPHADDRH